VLAAAAEAIAAVGFVDAHCVCAYPGKSSLRNAIARTQMNQPYKWLAELPPTARQSWSARAVAVAALVGFGFTAPFAGRPLVELNALFPSLDAIVFVTELITAALLFAQFSILGSRALFALASGYLFTALIVIPHALTFRGAFSPTGLLGAGIQTGSWLFIFWHAGFAVGLLAYALLRKKDRYGTVSETPMLPAIACSVASVFGLVCILTWLSTAGANLLPAIILDQTRISPFVIYPVLLTIGILAAGLAVLAIQRRSVLDDWLMVVALVAILEMAFSGLLPPIRFSVGFYAGRVMSLIMSSIVLIILVIETTLLYARSARASAIEQRERERRLSEMEAVLIHLSRVGELGQNVSALAHEVSQPLTAISNYAAAGVRLAETAPERLKPLLERLSEQAMRAREIVQNLRDFVARHEPQKRVVDVDEVFQRAVRLALTGERERTPLIEIQCSPAASSALIDRVQIEQVVFNLVRNAVEAMAECPRRALTLATGLAPDDMIEVSVTDTGPGLAPEIRSRLFEPFVTTKPAGLGIGLSICRVIVEAHGGKLRADANPGGGTAFHFTIPRSAPI
jgi:signal transduction histidine kinase